MELDAYLLNTDGIDWGTVLGGWSDLLPEVLTVWFVNRFGDLILVFEDGSVHFFDVGAAFVKRIADSREHFFELMDVDGNANNWLATPLVDECVAASLTLSEGRCYCFKIPPLLGGEYALENIGTISVAEHYSFLADLWRRARHLPDGKKVRIVVTNLPEA